jgi:hypothetical protein
MTDEGLEEYHIEKIVDERKRGHGFQYLVRWSDTLKAMISGYPDGNWKIVKCWTAGRLVRQRKHGSFFPLGFLMHLMLLVDVGLNDFDAG